MQYIQDKYVQSAIAAGAVWWFTSQQNPDILKNDEGEHLFGFLTPEVAAAIAAGVVFGIHSFGLYGTYHSHPIADGRTSFTTSVEGAANAANVVAAADSVDMDELLPAAAF